MKPLFSLVIVDTNKTFLSHVGEDLSKETDIAVMDEVNRTSNNSTEEFEEAAYSGTISTSGTDVMDHLACVNPGSHTKILKTFVPP